MVNGLCLTFPWSVIGKRILFHPFSHTYAFPLKLSGIANYFLASGSIIKFVLTSSSLPFHLKIYCYSPGPDRSCLDIWEVKIPGRQRQLEQRETTLLVMKT